MKHDRAVIALRSMGPCSSPELAANLVETLKISPALARQLISRSGQIKKLAHLPLPRRARFVYLQRDYGAPLFWHKLTECLLEHSTSYGGGLAALVGRSGMMPVAHFLIACGAPVAQKKRIPSVAVLEKLIAAELVRTFEVSGIGQCVELIHRAQPTRHEISTMRARLKSEQLLLAAVKDWAKKLGLVSYEKVRLRDEGGEDTPKVGPFLWDLTGPSYIGPLASWDPDGGKPKPGFLVCDVLGGVRVTALTMKPFLSKCSNLRAMPKIGRCMQLFIADEFDSDAFRAAKEKGVVAATVETLFGVEVARALRELADVLKQVVPADGNVDKLDEIFSKLSHIEGAANNLRGALFEFLVAEVQRLTVPADFVRLNEVFHLDGRKVAEVDVLVYQRRRTLRLIECKGYKPGGPIPDEMIEFWLMNRVPTMYAATSIDANYRDCPQQFEFWTSGRVSTEARERVNQRNADLRKYSVIINDCEDLPALIADTRDASLKASFSQHFQNHPLSKIDRRNERHSRQLPPVQGPELSSREESNEYLEE